MVDAITTIPAATGSFDTPTMQIARARAQATAANSNEVAFLREIARTNEDINARALTSIANSQPSDPFFNSGLPEEEPTTDPTDPFNQPTPLSIFGLGTDVTSISSKISPAQQLHDIAILQRDAELLEEAANANTPLPLSNAATTLDLSPEAQELINDTASFTSAQLLQTRNMLQPVANETLTHDLLQQIQAQLVADQNPIKLSLATIALAINYIAGTRPNQTHVMGNPIFSSINKTVIAPVSVIDNVAIEDNAIH